MPVYRIEGQAKRGERLVWEGVITLEAPTPNDARERARTIIRETAGEDVRALVPVLRRDKEEQ